MALLKLFLVKDSFFFPFNVLWFEFFIKYNKNELL